MPPKRRSRRNRRAPFDYRGGARDMRYMVRDTNRTILGVAGIGAVSTLGFGVLGALKP